MGDIAYSTTGEQPFSADQRDAVDFLRDARGTKRSYILTGAAGAGKSEVVKCAMRMAPDDYVICSTTARSALLIGGCTVDGVFCFSRDDWSIWSVSYLDRVMNEISDNIIIDEASMIGKEMAMLIREIAQQYNKTVIMVGDWAQAQPVKDEWPFMDELFAKADVLKLTENHRQHKGEYLTALNQVRAGELTMDTFNERIIAPHEVDERAVRVYTSNSKVEDYNRVKLLQHCKESGELGFGCMTKVINLTGKDLSEDAKSMLIKNTGFAHQSSFAIGCRVMVIRNANRNNPGIHVNGDTGVMLDAIYKDKSTWSSFSPSEKKEKWKTCPRALRIKLDRGPVITVSLYTDNSVTALGKVKQQIIGLPVALGYAFTIHKTQGMTIPKVYANIEDVAFSGEDFKHGLAYVAMSRTEELGDLYLDSDPKRAVYCDPIVSELI